MSNDPQIIPDQNSISCLIKDIQFFGSGKLQSELPSVNKYRTRFNEKELTYLYWDIEIINPTHRKKEYSTKLKVRCVSLTTQKEMYAQEHDVKIPAQEISQLLKLSWGTPESGYWKSDQYFWEISENSKMLMTKTIFVDNMDPVTETDNPYFDFESVKLYPAYFDMREDKGEGRRYLSQFDVGITEYVGVELNIFRKFLLGKTLEFKLYIFNAANGTIYASYKFDKTFNAITSAQAENLVFSYGTPQPGYWKKGEYFFYVNFMDVNIASGKFTVGETEIAGSTEVISNLPGATQRAKQKEETQENLLEEALAELDKLVGMTQVKKTIRDNIEYLKFNKLRMEKGFSDDGQLGLHSIFTGNPGTGKTTVVRLLGKIYKSMGLLSKGHVVEASRADIIGEFIGQTAPKTKAMIEKARGGILFLDEVYALSREADGKDFGAEAIEILMKEMSDGPGNIAIIGAGYPDEVRTFLNSNPGLKSRFSQTFYFEDYLPEELIEISHRALELEEATLSTEGQQELKKILTEIYRGRDRNFGNARTVIGIIDEAKKQMGIRLLQQGNWENLSAEELSRIELIDLLKVFEKDSGKKLKLEINQNELNEALAELDQMVGLEDIKQMVRDKINLVKFYSETGKDALHKFSLHAILTGNPGTGKTTLARILGKIYKALGLLERGHLVEVDRQNLVAGYVGQTALKTSNAIERAMGGVLFIDEAYSLAQGTENDFGSEAIETLLKSMEDNRGKFAVLAAGYPDNMYEFVQSNPGLKSRFDAVYQLSDYTFEDLFNIGERLFSQYDLHLDAPSKEHISAYLKKAYDTRDKYFGNARYIRQMVDSVVNKQHLRMASLAADQRTAEILKEIRMEDVAHLEATIEEGRQKIGYK